ncbi:MAG: hypothetical protein LBB94_00420 [Clostridiales bacterium]|jgi:bacteriocin-like protein|nr:hypothetical protein [Clostridiales bacterium]
MSKRLYNESAGFQALEENELAAITGGGFISAIGSIPKAVYLGIKGFFTGAWSTGIAGGKLAVEQSFDSNSVLVGAVMGALIGGVKNGIKGLLSAF